MHRPEASLASDRIPMEDSCVEETGTVNVAEGIDKLRNTGVSDVFDEGKDVIMKNGENRSKLLEDFEQINDLKDVNLKETSREEENKNSNSLTVIDVINFEGIPNGETTDRHFENGEVYQHLGGKSDGNEQEDSLDIKKALKMPQNVHKNEPDESGSTSMQDLVPENSSKEIISEGVCEGDHSHQSDKTEERGKTKDVQVIESMEGKGNDPAEDDEIESPIQNYGLEPSAVVKNLKPEEIADPKSLESETEASLAANGAINFEDIPNGETTDTDFENGEVSQHIGGKRDENKQEDCLNIKEALKMPQNEHKNEPGKSDYTSIQDLIPKNSSKEFISEEFCKGDHFHRSDKMEERSETKDVQAIACMEMKGTDQAEDNAMELPLQHFELEPPAMVLKINPARRASIWDCCCFWSWLHTHEDY